MHPIARILRTFGTLNREPIPRAEGVSGRAVWLAMGGRFTDELLSGLPDVLMPTIRRQLGLRFAQVGLLSAALNYVAAGAEPVNGLLIDVWRRRWLLAWGAAVIGLATIVLGLAPGFSLLLFGFALYGLGSGPLAHTADVVLVESHPRAPDRIFARSTAIDTVGALAAPLAVATALSMGLNWRWLLVGGGAASLVYAVALLRTSFPPPGGEAEAEPEGRSGLRRNVREVLSSRRALGWLAFLLAHDLMEAPLVLKTLWLADVVGLDQTAVGLFRAGELVIALLAVVWLDRWLARTPGRRVVLISLATLFVLYPAFLLTPGTWSRVLLAVPLNFFASMLWPLARAQSLVSVPGRPGTVTAVRSLASLLPLGLGAALVAEWLGLTPAMLAFTLAGLAAMTVLALRPGLWGSER